MSVLVTGGAGYIGSHMVWELVGRGEKVTVLDDLSSGFEWAVAPQAELVVGDIGDRVLLDRLMRSRGVQTVMHFAGSVVVPDSVADPLGYYLNNTVKSRALIEAAVQGGVEHFIFSSTAAVYGDVDTKPVGEDRPLNPVSPYGRSKLMTEWMLADAAAAHGLRYVILRYFNVAGADPRGRSGQSTANATHLIKVAAQTALGQRKSIEIYGTDYPTPDGSCLRDYIQVSDLAAAHLDALTHLRRGGESLTLNCGYGTGYSVFEVIEVVRRVSGINFEVRLSPRRPGDPAAIVAKADRIRERLGWQPRYDDLTTIVDQALRWEKALLTRNQI
jgi:UDP-glucose 4-epimerase